MSQTERIYRIVQLLENSRQPVPIARFLDELEISRATFKRDIEYLRDRLGAPVLWQRGTGAQQRGYRLAGNSTTGDTAFSMPGLWFNQSELHALLVMHQLAGDMQSDFVSQQAEALATRIRHMLGSANDDPQAIIDRIRILHSSTRRRHGVGFADIAQATINRRRLRLLYFTRSRNEAGERLVSPQRMLHYRENWYLLAWCHRADDLRIFALDAIRQVETTREAARRVAARRLDNAIGSGFGIFGGKSNQLARLRFNADAARWVRDETWHPQQRLVTDGDGLILEVPYSQPRELLMEILRHGSDVEVLAPPSLRDAVRGALATALAQYKPPNAAS
ncbi:MAG: WYL domain-containing protein [Gammaproteobacteria bacterium]|nr:WYL domain-containing protein [Gammaproteobacteria bacterium]